MGQSIAHYTSQAKCGLLRRAFDHKSTTTLPHRKTKGGKRKISYLVCHMEKYHKNEISPVEKENERDETYEAGNPQIDNSRTKNNYHTVKRNAGYNEYINKRISELNLPTKPRKDAVFMASFVIGSDGKFFDSLSQDEQERFFVSCTWFFARRYGKENIISAVVHADETTPHLHLNLIPIKDGRLCAKELYGRKELSQLQTDFHETVGKQYGLQRGKEGSQRKHLDTAEYKAQQIKIKALLEKQELEKANELAKQHFDDTLQKVEAAKAERDKIIADRNAEADYTKALQEAKDGKITHGKTGLKEQVVALTVENKRLETENKRLARDNEDLFNRHKGFETNDSGLSNATKAISLFRTHEPEAFARVFYRASGILQAFIPPSEAPANLGRKRLREIEEEIKRENELSKNKSNNSNNTNSK